MGLIDYLLEARAWEFVQVCVRCAAILLCALLFGLHPSGEITAQPAVIEQLSFDTNRAPNVRLAKITATLYLPFATKPVPAMVIISSSGGVLDWIEGYYARELVRHGIAGLVVDSFKPRGVNDLVEDQSLVTSWDMENDALAALAVLQKDNRIEPAHIGVMGMSKGGLVAQHSAFVVRQNWRRTADLAFAAHIAIAPPCEAQHRNAKTTGKPIFYMLAELDDAGLAKPCVDYAERIKAAGNPNVALKIYKDAHHTWENTRPVSFLARGENYSKCFAIIEDNGAYVMAAGKGPTLSKSADIFAWRIENCRSLGFHVGGGTEKLKREATGDLIAFLKRNGF